MAAAKPASPAPTMMTPVWFSLVEDRATETRRYRRFA